MSELKTRPNRKSVSKFIGSLPDPVRRSQCRTLVELMQDVTGAPPMMWGESIVGFGRYHYTYGSGREGDWFLTGFSPRKQALTIYLMSGIRAHGELLRALGPYRSGASCLYLKGLEQVHMPTLKRLLRESVKAVRRRWLSRAVKQ